MSDRRFPRWIAAALVLWTLVAFAVWEFALHGGSDGRILCGREGNPCHLPLASDAGTAWAAGVIGILAVALVIRWRRRRGVAQADRLADDRR
jgi:hypothetical protein